MEKKKGTISAQKNLYTAKKCSSSDTLMSESIIKFNQFIMNEKLGVLDEGDDVIAFLYSLKDNEVTEYVNGFLTTSREEDKEYYLQDILLEIGTIIDDNKYNWVSKELKKFFRHDKRKHK